MSHEPFLDQLAKLFTELHMIENKRKQNLAMAFCIEKLIDFALEHEIASSTEGMTEQ